MISLFKILLGYHLQLSYEDNYDIRSKLQMVEKNTAVLHNLVKELKVNLTKSVKL